MNKDVKKITYIALCSVLNYVIFTYGKINIPLSTGNSTAIHIANAMVVFSGWILGPLYGGLAGAIGLSLADLMDPRYITSAPKTFIMKFMIGAIAGYTANILGLHNKTEKKEMAKIAAVSAGLALGFNVLVDPIFGYFYKTIILGIPQETATIMASWSAGITFINAIICLIIDVLLYLSLYKSIRRLRNEL